jgi:hypothetical protein
MDKLRSLLAVVDRVEHDVAVLDKAVFLARHFGATVELMLGDSTQACAFANLCAAKKYDEVTLFSMFRGTEPMQDIILRRVLTARPDLVVKASAGSHPLRRWTRDDNDWPLAHECPVPLLLVRERPWTEPLHFAAAVDVADREAESATRAILQAGSFLTLATRGHLDVLYSERERADEARRIALAGKVAKLLREVHVGPERLQTFEGTPEVTLSPLLAARGYDVVLLSAVPHRDGIAASWSSLTSQLADVTPGDVLLVPCGALATPTGIESHLLRQQRPYEKQQFV